MIRKELPHITIGSKVENKEFEKVDINSPKPKKMNKLISLLGALRRTIAGKNKAGETIHGVLDLLPIPNQIIAKLAGLGLDNVQVKDVLTFRNLVALILSILIVSGVLSWEDVKNGLGYFAQIAELIK